MTELVTKDYGPKLPQFDERIMEAFNLLKKVLVAPPVLRVPRQGLRNSVDTDAC